MSKETKLGLVFIGMLLAVFTALLVKRLTHPQSISAMNLFGSATEKPAETSPVRAPAQSSPKLVTPSADNQRPPDLAYDNSLDKNRYGSHSNSDSMARGRSDANPAAANSGSLLAAPLPIGMTTDRYSSSTTSMPRDRTDDTSSREQNKSFAASPAPLPYQSAYGAVADDRSSTSPTSTSAPYNQTTSTQQTTSGNAPNPLPSSEPAAAYPLATTYDTPKYDSKTDSPKYDAAKYETAKYENQPVSSAAIDSPRATMQSSVTSTATVAATANRNTPPPGFSDSTSSKVAASNPSSYGSSTSTPRSQYTASPIADTASSSSTAWTAVSTAQSTPASQYSANQSVGGQSSYPTAAAPQDARNAYTASPPTRVGNEYTVGPNDSYWNICQRAYGNGAYFKALYEHNKRRLKEPDQLKVGQVLLVPDEAALVKMYPDLCPKPHKPIASAQQRLVSASTRMRTPGRIYTVAEGDTLFEIARHELGKATRWAEIYELNREVLGDDFDYLRTGTELILPVDAPTQPPVPRRINSGDADTNTARQPGVFYPR